MYDDWIRALRPRSQPTAMRLVCFPHAGGSATFYHPLSRLVDADIEILAVQYPGGRTGCPSR
ncbi:thioesterase domain-containing protein [Micromonospora sp. M12]